MQYLCVLFTFQSISAYLIHIVSPRFKQKDRKFCCSSLAKTGDTSFDIFFFFFFITHLREDACRVSTKIIWILMTWVSCALGQGNCNISSCADWHSCKCTCANTHIRARTHTRTHTRTHAHTLSCSLALSHGTLSCTIMQIKQRSETQIKITLNSIIFTQFEPKSLRSIKAVAPVFPFNLRGLHNGKERTHK